LKKLIFILLALPVVIVVLFLATKMRWKWSKPARPPVVQPNPKRGRAGLWQMKIASKVCGGWGLARANQI
jgi:hypothetical protein